MISWLLLPYTNSVDADPLAQLFDEHGSCDGRRSPLLKVVFQDPLYVQHFQSQDKNYKPRSAIVSFCGPVDESTSKYAMLVQGKPTSLLELTFVALMIATEQNEGEQRRRGAVKPQRRRREKR